MVTSLLIAAIALPPLLPVERVERGHRGECLTVFEGDSVESFPFVVRGVMKDFLGPRQDLVLVRLLGDKAEYTGVVAGMSGSPCSIGGKLVGALSYAFATFAKEPIAGITPIDSMIGLFKLPAETRPWSLGSRTPEADWKALQAGRAPPGLEVAAGPRPIATPLALGGLPSSVRDHFTPCLRAMGFEPIASGSADADAVPGALVPGSAVAAVLVSGDVDIAATGTVTSVDGKQVLAFGHPFFGAGAISIPMANATILNTMVSARRSYKMSTTGRLIGEVTQDRLTGISGRIGEVPAMVPVRGTVTTPRGKSTFSLDVARDLVLTPRFVAIGAASALVGRIDIGERGVVRLSGRIDVEGIQPVVVEEVYAAERDANLLIRAAIDMGRTFATLWDTPFGPPPTIAMQLDAVYEPEPVHEWIEAVYVDRPRVRPGENLEVAVRLRRNDGPTDVERFLVRVPGTWAKQPITVVATGVSGAEELARKVGGDPRPESLEEVAAWLSRRRADGRVYLLAVRQGAGMQAGVDVLPFLPPSVVATISGDPSKQKRKSGLAWEEYRRRPGVVMGEAATTVEVLSRE